MTTATLVFVLLAVAIVVGVSAVDIIRSAP
jgi:hypothetical protein